MVKNGESKAYRYIALALDFVDILQRLCIEEPPILVALCVIALILSVMFAYAVRGAAHAVSEIVGHVAKVVMVIIACVTRIIMLIIRKRSKSNIEDEEVEQKIDRGIDNIIVAVFEDENRQEEKKLDTPTLEAEAHSKSGFKGKEKKKWSMNFMNKK